MKQARILIATRDEKGLVYKVAKLFFDLGLNIESNQEFVDKSNNRFFMRSVVEGRFENGLLKQKLVEILPQDACIEVVEPKPKRIVVMATKESHAIGDLLIRHAAGELDAKIECVISNRNVLRDLVERFDIPFFFIDSDSLSRQEHEQKVIERLNQVEFDYLVLAKYMRILTSEFVERYKHKIINIHHSFLPAFVGANPYKQAYERGVKIIGATAHFVTKDLDEGPIITQDVIPVTHREDWKQMRQAGRDVEKVVLARALALVFEDRVFVDGNKTIIL